MSKEQIHKNCRQCGGPKQPATSNRTQYAPRHPLGGPRLHHLSRSIALLYSVSRLRNRHPSTHLRHKCYCPRYLFYPNKSEKDLFWKNASQEDGTKWNEWAEQNSAAIQWNQERADSHDDESVQQYAPDFRFSGRTPACWENFLATNWTRHKWLQISKSRRFRTRKFFGYQQSLA
eukprot:g36952.t1